ncbi:hypothetical protein HKD37_18G050306 [Glycine soja]
MAQSNSSRLGFPSLITTLCIARGVVSDSLMFESLSPAINLAYIRKNYWNPEDPSITFPGSRKATTQAPSDALTPTLALVPPPPAPISTPAGPSAPSSDTIVPMLQSIHHGLCLVMQSMQNLSQQQPIMSMEDFLEQVAWPEVQPSFLGGGEALVAQEPQI